MPPRSRKPKRAVSDRELMNSLGYYDLLDFFKHDSRGLYHRRNVASLWRYLASQADTGLTAYYRQQLVTEGDLIRLRGHWRAFTISRGSLLAFCALLHRNPRRGLELCDDQRALLMDWSYDLERG